MHSAFIFGSFSIIAIASVYFLIKNRLQYILYSVVVFLVLANVAGAFFKIMHLTGADELLILGISGSFLGSVLLMLKSFRNKNNQFILNKLIVGILILLQLTVPFFLPSDAESFGGLLNYPITALLATVLLNDQAEHEGEKNMMILFLLQSLFYIVINLLDKF
jgi:peptidoglycan/LPS O-acetylase OafA/YrhL